MEVFLDDKCSCAVSVFFRDEQKENEPSNTVLLFMRPHNENDNKLLFAIPPNGTIQVHAPCSIKRIIVKNGDAIQLIPLTSKINQ